MPLNQTLYQLLCARFGDVRIVNDGQSLIGDYKSNPITDRIELDIDHRGETYAVSCCYCNDTRNRLYINHRYGAYDDVTRSDNRHLVRCFNEECFKRDTSLINTLYNKIFTLTNLNQRNHVSYLAGRKIQTTVNTLKEVEAPGVLQELAELPLSHPANQFLLSRGYKIEEVVARHSLLYCQQANPSYSLAANRIIIPIIQEQMWVGWQARYIGDIDWKYAKIPKYYTLPGLAKRLVLYNYDVALAQELVIVTEGPSSCWSVYPYGVALLGKQATIQQVRILAKKCADKTVVILLDGDANADAMKLHKQLKKYIKNLVRVELPSDRDPGCYYTKQDELWSLILQAANKSSVSLPTHKGLQNGQTYQASNNNANFAIIS